MREMGSVEKEEERRKIEKIEGRHCFACGTANPIGLKMEFYFTDGWVCSEVTLGENHVGWENMAHGGIISTLLDEAMSWAVIYFRKCFFVTRKMEIKYIKPVLIGCPLTIQASLVDASEELKIRARSEIRDEGGGLLVRSSGEFVALSEEKLSLVPKEAKDEMSLLFKRFP
jgi:uncharacterized protein (TIGR00369 family)